MATLCIQQSAIVPDVRAAHNRPPGHALRPCRLYPAAANNISRQSKFLSFIVFTSKKQE